MVFLDKDGTTGKLQKTVGGKLTKCCSDGVGFCNTSEDMCDAGTTHTPPWISAVVSGVTMCYGCIDTYKSGGDINVRTADGYEPHDPNGFRSIPHGNFVGGIGCWWTRRLDRLIPTNFVHDHYFNSLGGTPCQPALFTHDHGRDHGGSSIDEEWQIRLVNYSGVQWFEVMVLSSHTHFYYYEESVVIPGSGDCWQWFDGKTVTNQLTVADHCKCKVKARNLPIIPDCTATPPGVLRPGGYGGSITFGIPEQCP